MNRNALPAIFPVEFSLDGADVVFPARNVPASIAGNVVCIFAEGDGWSVSVTGAALVEGDVVYVSTAVIDGECYSAASVAQ